MSVLSHRSSDQAASRPSSASEMAQEAAWEPQLLQAIFFGVACLDDVLKRITGRKNIKFVTAFRDLLFTTLAFPVSTFIFLSFWTIFLYNRELVYPRSADAIFPVWLNHAMHTSIVPLSLLEIVLRPHHYPSRKAGLTLLAAGSLAYISRVLWIYSETGKWVYPVFAKLSPVGLAVFFSLSFVLSAGIYLFGEKLNHWKWGRKDADPRTQVPQEEKTNLKETADPERD